MSERVDGWLRSTASDDPISTVSLSSTTSIVAD